MGDNTQGGYGQYNPYGAQENPYAQQQQQPQQEQPYGYGGGYGQAGAMEQGNGGYGEFNPDGPAVTLEEYVLTRHSQKCPTCSSPAARP